MKRKKIIAELSKLYNKTYIVKDRPFLCVDYAMNLMMIDRFDPPPTRILFEASLRKMKDSERVIITESYCSYYASLSFGYSIIHGEMSRFLDLKKEGIGIRYVRATAI